MRSSDSVALPCLVPPCAFSAGSERHDWLRGGYKPPRKVGACLVCALLQPRVASRSEAEERPRRPLWLPGLPWEFDWRGLGNRARRPLSGDWTG